MPQHGHVACDGIRDLDALGARTHELIQGGLDEGVNRGIAAYEDALKKANITYELYMYEGAQHAFHNDTAPTRYNEEAAKLAWKRTIEFFGKHLK